MWADILDSGISFDDCIIGNTYFKDFTLWNKSEIELFWSVNIFSELKSGGNLLEFSDCNTGEPLDRIPIPSYSHRRIRVSLQTRVVGEFVYEAELLNLNDISNCIPLNIHAVIRFAPSEESLLIPHGKLLDFGDCCAGKRF